MKIVSYILLCLLAVCAVRTASAIPIKLEITSNIRAPSLSGRLRIDLIDGDGLDGSSVRLAALSSPPTSFGGAVNELASGVFYLSDEQFISSLYVDLANVYTGFGMLVDLNLREVSDSGFPDSVVLTFLDAISNPLFHTPDPRGTDAALILSALGRETYAPAGFQIEVNELTMIREPASIYLAVIGVMSLALMRRKRSAVTTAVLFFGIGTANAALNDVTHIVAVSKAPLAYNRVTGTYDALISLRNVGLETLHPPMYVVVTSLPGTVSVNNATNLSPDGKPMVMLPVSEQGLAPGAAIANAVIRFYNPSSVKFAPTLRVLSFTGAKLPPDPGPAGKASLAGIDSNRNGVRDDVEIYIAANFGHSEKLVQGLNDYAVAAQRGILSTNLQESLQATNLLGRAMECLKHVSPEEQAVRKSVLSVSVNTPERLSVWLQHQERLGGNVLRSRPISEWATSCTFEIEAFRN